MAPDPRPVLRRRLPELEGVRGIATIGMLCLVPLGSVWQGLLGEETARAIFGAVAQMFIVISGFATSLRFQSDRSALGFVLSRFAKLAPALVVAVLISWGLAQIHPSADGVASSDQTAPQFIFALLIAYVLYYLSSLAFAWAKWSSQFEGLAVLLLAAETLWVCFRSALVLPLQLMFFLNMAHLFAAGILFERLYTAGINGMRLALLGGCLILQHAVSGLIAGFVAVVYMPLFLMICWKQASWLDSRALQFLGRISYSLFLVQVPLCETIHRLVGTGNGTSVANPVASTVISVAFATVLTFVVERPIYQWAAKTWKSKVQEPSVSNPTSPPVSA